MSVVDALGHVSYLLIAFSYLVTHMLWLRMLAIAGLLAESVYFYLAGSGSLWVAIGWSIVFLAINAVQLLRLLREIRFAELSLDERLLKDGIFSAMSTLSFRRLMNAGRWRTAEAGENLTVQRAAVTHLRVLSHGMANVVVDGQTVATAFAGSIVGEMSLLTGDAASATVTVTQPTRLFEVDVESLKLLLATHEDLHAQFHMALGGELAAKVMALRGRPNTAPPTQLAA